MGFTREDLVEYAKKTPAASAPEPATPAAIAPETPAPEASSAPAATPPVEPASDDTSAENAAPATASADPESETPPDEPAADAAPAPHGRARERIEGLIVERDALRKYGEFLQARNEELLRKTGTAPPPTAEVVADAEDAPPTMEAHNYDPIAYSKAQNVWLKRQVDKGIAAGLDRAAEKQTVEQIATKFQERSDEFAKANPTFKTLIANPALPALSKTAARLIMTSEQGPAIHFHLAQHPDLAARLARMPADQQAMQIGKIEGLVSQTSAPVATPPAKQQKSVTKAPAPPTPIPAGTSPANKRMEDMTMDEWVAHDRAQKIAVKQQRQKLRAAMR